MKAVKRGILCMLTVLMCLTGLTGCSKWTYTTYVTDDYFNRIGFGPLYYIWIEYDDYENPDAPKEITIEQDGKNYTAAYKHTHRMYNYSYSYDLYESEELVVYKASETGFTHYVYFRTTKGDYLLPEIDDPEGTAIQIADAFVAQYADLSDYRRTVKYEDGSKTEDDITYPYGEYCITYTKTVGDLDTNDLFEIIVNSKGNLVNYLIGELGRYDKLSSRDISLDAVNDSITAKLQGELYELKGYKYVSHEINEQILCYTATGDLAVRTDMHVLYRNDEMSEERFRTGVTTVITDGDPVGYEESRSGYKHETT